MVFSEARTPVGEGDLELALCFVEARVAPQEPPAFRRELVGNRLSIRVCCGPLDRRQRLAKTARCFELAVMHRSSVYRQPARVRR